MFIGGPEKLQNILRNLGMWMPKKDLRMILISYLWLFEVLHKQEVKAKTALASCQNVQNMPHTTERTLHRLGELLVQGIKELLCNQQLARQKLQWLHMTLKISPGKSLTHKRQQQQSISPGQGTRNTHGFQSCYNMYVC